MVTASLNASPQNNADVIVGKHLGRYQVLFRMASGGMASVYAARAYGVAGFERLVAIKLLHPHLAYEDDFIRMFLDEARLAARIHHPNVVGTLDVSETGDSGYFLVMEYIEGDNLGALLRQAALRNERLPDAVILRAIVDALTGLAAAHDLVDDRGEPLNLIHRDISPQNIMMGVNGTTRITDFGVARAAVRLTSTRQGEFKGKLAYAAPEYLAGQEIDQRSDLFAMGVVLWEAFASERLFRAQSDVETLNRILYHPIPLLSSVRPDLQPLDAVVARALERNPNNRYSSASEFIEAIEQVASKVGGLGTTRAVGEVVRRYATDKLASERKALRAAIESLGTAEHLSILDREPSNSSVSLSRPRLAQEPLDAETVAGPTSLSASRIVRSRRSLVWLVAAAVLGVIAAVLLSIYLEHENGAKTGKTALTQPEPGRTPPQTSSTSAEKKPAPALSAPPVNAPLPAAAPPVETKTGRPTKKHIRTRPPLDTTPPPNPPRDPGETDLLTNPYRR